MDNWNGWKIFSQARKLSFYYYELESSARSSLYCIIIVNVPRSSKICQSISCHFLKIFLFYLLLYSKVSVWKFSSDNGVHINIFRLTHFKTDNKLKSISSYRLNVRLTRRYTSIHWVFSCYLYKDLLHVLTNPMDMRCEASLDVSRQLMTVTDVGYITKSLLQCVLLTMVCVWWNLRKIFLFKVKAKDKGIISLKHIVIIVTKINFFMHI